MPEICHFFGIAIKMYFGDHPPPYFHAEYGEHQAVIDIRNLSGTNLISGCQTAPNFSNARATLCTSGSICTGLF